jgi:hypothetical protein
MKKIYQKTLNIENQGFCQGIERGAAFGRPCRQVLPSHLAKK